MNLYKNKRLFNSCIFEISFCKNLIFIDLVLNKSSQLVINLQSAQLPQDKCHAN